ncbi:hypothetical protein [Rubritalea profundi]|uniref:hypothetical protein n=1 Tax=Rubritalea profundi TaxID=1658618 RepID=UPI0013FD3D02|nr:hypothetical protein [Rubritalea profundi]
MFTNPPNHYSIIGVFLTFLLASCSEKQDTNGQSGAEAIVVVEHNKLDYNRDV